MDYRVSIDDSLPAGSAVRRAEEVRRGQPHPGRLRQRQEEGRHRERRPPQTGEQCTEGLAIFVLINDIHCFQK